MKANAKEWFKQTQQFSRSQIVKMGAEIGVSLLQTYPQPSEVFDDWVQPLIPSLSARLASMGEAGNRALLTEHCLELWRLARWAAFGFNIFRPSENLVTGLLMTDPAKTNERLNLPFPNFQIQLPEKTIPIFTEDEQFWADTLWVEMYEVHTKHGTRTPWFRYTVSYKSIHVYHDANPDDIDSSFGQWKDPLSENDVALTEGDDLTVQLAFRLIKNFCSWMTLQRGLKPEKFGRSGKGKKKDKNPKPTIWIIGQEVKLPPELKDRREDYALGRTRKAPKGWKQRVRSIIRGHFQHYWTGPEGERVRKLHWKQPYWRNLNEQVAYGHLYKDD